MHTVKTMLIFFLSCFNFLKVSFTDIWHCQFFGTSTISSTVDSIRWTAYQSEWGGMALMVKFTVTLQANAMWTWLIHGSQVLNTATLPTEAVIHPPSCPWSMTPSNFLGRSHHRDPCLEVGGGGLWLSGGQTQDVGNKGRVLQSHFIPIHNLCLNSHGIQTAVPNKAQVQSLCWFYRRGGKNPTVRNGDTERKTVF